MTKKRAVNLYVDSKLVKEARELGGQPSKIFENALKDFIARNKPGPKHEKEEKVKK